MKLKRPRIDKVTEAGLKELEVLWARDTAVVGRILHCHLMIEFYMFRLVEASCPLLTSWKDARLSYSQLIPLIQHKLSPLKCFAAGLKKINALRNKTAHSLDVELPAELLETLTSEIKTFYRIVAKKECPLLPSGIDLLEFYSKLVCSCLGGTATLSGHPYTQLFGSSDWEERMAKFVADRSHLLK